MITIQHLTRNAFVLTFKLLAVNKTNIFSRTC
nr:MAG TPA: hypothetical protein [Crassvirales sp.]